ncbi:MAG: histidinol-phosphatase [Candidatus Aminicenantes bacterium]|nr:histidinol-phosphatase [Candidatus Aminicenantes bacterium]
MESVPWKVSLHGGHSGAFCDHAEGTLQQILEAAVAQQMSVFGISEHAPRLGERFLYTREIELGWDVAKLERDFQAYRLALDPLVREFAPHLQVLRGFEAEVVPSATYADVMHRYRSDMDFDYMVGSVHFVGEIIIDGEPEDFERALNRASGLENLAIRYYEGVARMVEALRPEVVGHLDLIRKNGRNYGPLDTPAIRRSARQALEVIRRHGCILDLNTAGYRKGLGCPYPEPWLLRQAHEMGIGVCFGDDSHGPHQVGAGIEEARLYLLDNGVSEIRTLAREGDRVVHRSIPLR